MQRDQWAFMFTAEKVADGAAKKHKYHTERLKFWEDARAKVMADVRETGIEVSESEAGTNYSNRYAPPQVMVRNDLQKRLTECHLKIQEHSAKIHEYAGWVEVLKGNPTATLSLHADDYLFFFGS